VRVRHGASVVSGEAAADPQLTRRLEAARLYVITPDAEPARILELANAAVRGGADVIQLRHKSISRGELLTLARQLREEIRDALFIVNDHVDIALLAGADGVHLGPDDLSVSAARKVAGDRLLIGVSASTAAAVPEGAAYVGCGAVFATPLKADKQPIGPQAVAALSAALTIPVFAIGGVDESNLPQVVAAGVRRACVIRAVADSPDPEQAARRLRAILTA
jgi:thiamine-phosphate pyrophosphorylase